jgi:3-phenylpropionate/trans-cinnamate dioxygenase ferredoxin reductase subunit
MSTKQETVIVGSGQAGFQLASSLRAAGFSGNIRLVGNEPPYQRPPLSKAFLSGELDRDDLLFASQDHYANNEIDLVQGAATAIEPSQRTVLLDGDGASERRLHYDHLILATGARNRQLPQTLGVDGVLSLRTVSDSEYLRDRMKRDDRLIVIGGGFLGLEVAAYYAAAGVDVHVLEMKPRVMSRGVSYTVAEAFRKKLQLLGVHFSLGVSNLRFRLDGRRFAGVEADGIFLGSRVALCSIGVVPNVELALEASLACQNGIVTDDHLRTSCPSIFAIGDCALHPNPWLGGVVRLESVQNALDQANCVANALAGTPHPYQALPWFWSEQAGSRLQIVGRTDSCCDDCFVSKDANSDAFSVFHFRNNVLVGVESVDRPRDQVKTRTLLQSGRPIPYTEIRDLFNAVPIASQLSATA